MQLVTRAHTRHYFISIFVVIAALFITFSLVIFNHFNQSQKLNDWTLYNFELARKSRLILFHMVDMETSVRGYLLTGKKEFLEPYKRASILLPVQISNLWDYSESDPTTRSNIEKWLKRIEQSANALQNQVYNFQKNGKKGLTITALEKQKKEMDEIRGLFENYIQARLEELHSQVIASKDKQENFTISC